MRLHEFQLNRPVTWLSRTRATFTVNEQTFEVDFYGKYSKSPLTKDYAHGIEVIFVAVQKHGRKTIDNTGTTGNAAQAVFSNVLSATIEFCNKEKPDFIYFTGDKDEGKAKLYRMMATFIIKRKLIPGYTKVFAKKGDTAEAFYVCRVEPKAT